MIERKKPKTSGTKGATEPGKSSFVCYECGDTGHTAKFCRKYLQAKGRAEKGEAKQAEAHSDSSSDDD